MSDVLPSDVEQAPCRVIDARGLKCPAPSLKLRRALAECASGDVVELWADDPMARIDVPHLVRQSGDQIVYSEATPEHLVFWVRKMRSTSAP